MQNTKSFSVLFYVIAFFLLTGFFFAMPEHEIMQFIRDTQRTVKVSHKLRLPAKPVIEKAEPFVYEAGDLDPFSLKSFVLDAQGGLGKDDNMNCSATDCGDGPPEAHDPYFLENFDLDKLQMVGTMNNKKGKQIALIRTPEMDVVRTRAGEYIGRNNGLILNVDSDHIVIQEKQRVPRGWQNRTSTLELFN